MAITHVAQFIYPAAGAAIAIASRKAGFSAALSDIALIVFRPKEGSFAQYGMTPAHEAKDALGLRLVLADGRDLLRRSDVPARCPGRIFIETKVVSM